MSLIFDISNSRCFCYEVRSIQEAFGNVSLELIRDIWPEYIKFRDFGK